MGKIPLATYSTFCDFLIGDSNLSGFGYLFSSKLVTLSPLMYLFLEDLKTYLKALGKKYEKYVYIRQYH